MMRAMSLSLYPPYVFIALAALAGWGVGLALRHLFHHLPLRLEAQWRQHALELESTLGTAPELAEPGRPAAQAPWHAAPAGTKTARSRWPEPVDRLILNHGARRWVPSITAVVFALAAYRYGVTWLALASFIFCATLIALAFIDAETGLLPDGLTLPLLWLGLLINSVNAWVSLTSAVWGAALGYGVLWLLFHGFKWVTGREGMGFGDFKLMAALGAWLGWHAVPWMLLVASLLGVVGALCLRAMGRAAPGEALPFGPYLALVGIAVMLWPLLLLR